MSKKPATSIQYPESSNLQPIEGLKALSLWQPWASLMQIGAKTVETRSWRTNYRGPLLICSTKGGLSKGDLKNILKDRLFQIGLADLLGPGESDLLQSFYDYADTFPTGKTFSTPIGFTGFYPVKINHLPFGKALCIVDLVDVVPMEALPDSKHIVSTKDLHFGDFTSGRYAWITENLRPIKPIDITGRQGLFNVPVEFQKNVEPVNLNLNPEL